MCRSSRDSILNPFRYRPVEEMFIKLINTDQFHHVPFRQIDHWRLFCFGQRSQWPFAGDFILCAIIIVLLNNERHGLRYRYRKEEQKSECLD